MIMNWSHLLLCCVAVSGVSCQIRYTGENMERAGRVLNTRRAASMAGWKDKTIRGLSPPAYAGLVTALTLPPDVVFTLRETKGATGSVKVGIRLKPEGDDFFIGSAVPLTRDGYFLTAAHCTEALTHLQVGVLTRNRTFAIAPARVIWKSAGPSEKGPDFALLHAPLRPFFSINMAEPDQLRIGLPVLTCGHSGSKPNHSGGKILRLSRREGNADGASWRRIAHSAPTAVGDSGGPVIGTAGELLGITTSGYWRFAFPFRLQQVWGYQGIAVAPDPSWIRALIEHDRDHRQMHGKAPE